MLHFRPITEENFDALMAMKRPDGEDFVTSNAYSMAQAWLYRADNVVYPFAIHDDDMPVGFCMLDDVREERVLVIWRIMFPEEHTGKGYGTQTIRMVADLAKRSGLYDTLVIQVVPENTRARHVYEKAGFKPNGRITKGEIVMEMPL